MPRKIREVPWLETRGGTYYVHWYDRAAGRTKRISLATADRVEAQTRFAEFLNRGHEIFRSDGAVGLSTADAISDYLREHVDQHVIDRIRPRVALRHLGAWFKNTPLVDIDIPACRAYAEARREGVVGRPAGDSTIRLELKTLQAAVNHAARWRRVGPAAQPPTAMPVIDTPRPLPKEGRWLTRDEVAQAIEKATGRLKDFIAIAYYTGARRRSVERLTRFQVDLAAGRITLRGADETAAQRRSSKRRPVVPIDPELRPTLERLMAIRPPRDWLLGTPGRIDTQFKRHMIRLGFQGRHNTHILRHSRATHLLLDGVPIYDVARLLGDTISTVDRTYGHHSPDYLAEALSKRRSK